MKLSTSVLASVTIAAATAQNSTTSAYACNPAHQYPTGQVCVMSGNGYYLTTATSTAVPTSAATSAATTSAYACNPAHQYPTGQECISTNSGYYLEAITGTAAAAATGVAAYTTEVVTAYTTYCPYATVVSVGSKTYTVSSATTLTVTDCPCTITRPVSGAANATATDGNTHSTTQSTPVAFTGAGSRNGVAGVAGLFAAAMYMV